MARIFKAQSDLFQGWQAMAQASFRTMLLVQQNLAKAAVEEFRDTAGLWAAALYM